jgi:hypothetical protein
MSAETACFAVPLPVFRLLLLSTAGTLATGTSFGASEAHDVDLLTFVGEIVDVAPIFPEGHALIVMTSTVFVADPMRIPNEERAHLLLHAEIDHVPCRLMSQVTDSPFRAPTHFALRTLEFLPSTRIPLASGLLLGKLAEVLMALSLE